MGSCSYWGYVDATGDAVEYVVEATCPLLRGDGGVVEPRGGVVRLSGRVGGFAPVSPCRPGVLPVPWPPYTVAEAVVVVDSRPGVFLHGLPERRSTVVSLTQRTLLEGRGYVQLVEAEPVAGGLGLYAPRLGVAGEFGYPLAGRGVEELVACEASRGFGLEAWGQCVEDLAGPGVLGGLVGLARSVPACAARAYAGLAARSGLDPYRLAGVAEPVRLEKTRGGVAARPGVDAPLVVLLGAGSPFGRLVLEARVEGETVIPGDWVEAAVECRRCWRRL